jgi:imidazolonepropionase
MPTDREYLLINARIATLATGSEPYGLINDGVIAVSNGKISWVGSTSARPATYAGWNEQDIDGRLVTPGLIDCHTHIVFGGNRALEFEMSLNGASYEDIARTGGGIVSTVAATRKAGLEALITDALTRLDALISEGVTCVEVKSGYGLDHDTELTMLRAARALATKRNVTIKTSFLGAHAVPAEFKDRADAYIDEICIPTLKAAHAEGLVDAVDGFCEGIAFTPDQIERVFLAAQKLGIPVKLHAEQLSNLGGTQLAARFNALSADHVEYATDGDAQALAKAGSVAVILPGAFYTLHETQAPPIDSFRKHGVPMAIATDCNPGSSPLASILLTMNMACTLLGLTPEEALAGVTRNAASALGLADRGEIREGLRADLAIWDVRNPAELSYRIGFNSLHSLISGGVQ